jgi:hypothetical protein
VQVVLVHNRHIEGTGRVKAKLSIFLISALIGRESLALRSGCFISGRAEEGDEWALEIFWIRWQKEKSLYLPGIKLLPQIPQKKLITVVRSLVKTRTVDLSD